MQKTGGSACALSFFQLPVLSKFHEPFWAPCKAPKIHTRYKRIIEQLRLGASQGAQKALNKIATCETVTIVPPLQLFRRPLWYCFDKGPTGKPGTFTLLYRQAQRCALQSAFNNWWRFFGSNAVIFYRRCAKESV